MTKNTTLKKLKEIREAIERMSSEELRELLVDLKVKDDDYSSYALIEKYILNQKEVDSK